jgi:hypothetical protein
MPDNPTIAYVILGIAVVALIAKVTYAIWQKTRIDYPNGIRNTYKAGGQRMTTVVDVPKHARTPDTTDDMLRQFTEACHLCLTCLSDVLIADGASNKEIKDRMGHVVTEVITREEWAKRCRGDERMLKANGTQGWIPNGPGLVSIPLDLLPTGESSIEQTIKNGSLVIHELLHLWLRWDSFHQHTGNMWADAYDGDPRDDIEEKAVAAYREAVMV